MTKKSKGKRGAAEHYLPFMPVHETAIDAPGGLLKSFVRQLRVHLGLSPEETPEETQQSSKGKGKFHFDAIPPALQIKSCLHRFDGYVADVLDRQLTPQQSKQLHRLQFQRDQELLELVRKFGVELMPRGAVIPRHLSARDKVLFALTAIGGRATQTEIMKFLRLQSSATINEHINALRSDGLVIHKSGSKTVAIADSGVRRVQQLVSNPNSSKVDRRMTETSG